jgi:hypothetical protein
MFNILFQYPRLLARHRQAPSAQAGSDTSPIAPIKERRAIPCYARPANFWSSPSASTSRPIG